MDEEEIKIRNLRNAASLHGLPPSEYMGLNSEQLTELLKRKINQKIEEIPKKTSFTLIMRFARPKPLNFISGAECWIGKRIYFETPTYKACLQIEKILKYEIEYNGDMIEETIQVQTQAYSDSELQHIKMLYIQPMKEN